MHKSKVAGFVIDCETEDLEAAVRFWSAALGLPAKRPAVAGENFVPLTARTQELCLEVQQVTHPSRVHLDIETDDIPAEVARLEALGARRVADVKAWVVMEAPTGQRFCVVRAITGDFARLANAWP